MATLAWYLLGWNIVILLGFIGNPGAGKPAHRVIAFLVSVPIHAFPVLYLLGVR